MKPNIKYRNLFFLKSVTIILIVQLFSNACKKFVDIGLPDAELSSSRIFLNERTAESAIMAIYGSMSGTTYYLPWFTGLSADEFHDNSNEEYTQELFNNSLVSDNLNVYGIWQRAYQNIYNVNSIIQAIPESPISEPVKSQLMGEAKFFRAFWYFYLINLYGDVPLTISTDYTFNSVMSRTKKTLVYDQIIADLKESEVLLPTNFHSTNGERIRVTAWAAKALLSRVYLYIMDWPNAEAKATDLIESNGTFLMENDLNSVFLKNSKEAIWQLKPLDNQPYNTMDGNLFILTADPDRVSLSPLLVKAFEADDSRKANWIGTFPGTSDTFYFPFKYKVKLTDQPVTEYNMVFRLAEQYLIRAESRTQQSKIAEALADLNVVRSRAGLGSVLLTDTDSLLQAILDERRVELFTEWGHRWLDLKRFNVADQFLEPIKMPNWQPEDTFYPIPQSEINANRNLTQNIGY